MTYVFSSAFFQNSLAGLFFFVCIAMNVVRIDKYENNDTSYRDFINPYVGTKLWIDNQNPYDDVLLKQRWKQIKREEHIPSEYIIGSPANPFVYPMISIPLFSWVHFFSYTQAYKLWLIACTAAMIGIYYYSLKLMSFYGITDLSDKLWFTGIFLSLKFLFPAFFLGQPCLIACAFVLSGYYYFLTQKTIVSGILLGLASIKITMLFPFFIIALIYRKWNILFILCSMLAILTGLFLVKDIPLSEVIKNYSTGIATLNTELFTIPAGNLHTDLMTKTTDITVLTTYLFHNSIVYAGLFKIILSVIVSALLYPHRNFLLKEQPLLLAFISIWSLLIMYHILYDIILLLPMYIVYKKYVLTAFQKTISVAFLLTLILPVNALLDALHASNPLIDIFYLHIPATLFCMCLGLISFCKKAFIPQQKQ